VIDAVYVWVRMVGLVIEGAVITSEYEPLPIAIKTLYPSRSEPPSLIGGSHLKVIWLSLLLTRSKFNGTEGSKAVMN
jgi:hypothetical protein